MPHVMEPMRETKIEGEFDVLVAGGGTAGVIAAVASARNGANTLLVERGGFLGGHIATQLLEHSAGWFDADGQPIVGGMPDELVHRLKRAGASPGHVRDDTGYTRLRLPVNHEVYKSVVTAWLVETGVDFLIQSPTVAAIEQDRDIAVIVENKSGRVAYAARAVVDATGDADICAHAGCAFLNGARSTTQPVSLLFKLGGVDHEVLVGYVNAHPDQFKLGVEPAALRSEPFVNLWGFGDLLAKAHKSGQLSLARNELHYAGNVETGEAVINVTRVAADATDAADLSRAETLLRKQVLEFLAFFRLSVPGCEGAFLAATASCAGVRESRRIKGVSILKDQDVRDGRNFADAVARGGFPIDSHDPNGKGMDAAELVPRGYDIPLGALMPDGGPNIVVAGRCISAERRALASARITGTCMAMGQAAGTAAALSAAAGKSIRALDVTELQSTLRAQGALFNGT